MIEFEIVTLFPEMFTAFLAGSLLGKAVDAGTVRVFFTSPRDFATDRHRTVDDVPYGGGVGMVMKPEPLARAIEAAEAARGRAHRVLLSPAGRPLDQEAVQALSARPRVLLLCGRYEGIDERVRTRLCDQAISIGDYVLSGGEPAAMVIIDAVARLLPGVLGKAASTVEESFSEPLLEYPQFTRPPEWAGEAVPEILLSGHHERIRRWRRREQLLRTRALRPDLFAKHELTAEDRRLLESEEP